MTPRPVLTRLFVPFAIVMALIVAVCGVVIYWAGQRAVQYQQVRELDRLTALVRQWLEADGPAGAQSTTVSVERGAQLRQAADLLATRITLIGPDGVVFFDTHADAQRMGNHNDRREVVEARREGRHVGVEVRRSDTIREPAVYVAEPLDRTRPAGVIIRLSYPRRYWEPLDTPVWAIVGGGVVAAGLAALALATMLQRRWVGPVRQLASAAERMAAGDWSARVAPDGAEELRAFSGQLNTVAENAGLQVEELRRQRSDLAALVDTLPDPLLVADADARVRHLNAPAAALLEVTAQQAIGRDLSSILSDAALLELCDQLLRGGAGAGTGAPPRHREIRLHRDGRRLHYQAIATRTAGGGVLLVLRDVSTLTQTVQMKSDFVANASHELRTPIAALKAAFETLADVKDDDPEQVDRCIRIMDGHLRRLEEMLRDLLDLSRVENAEMKPELTEVRAADLFAAARATLGPMADQKGVELAFDDGGGDDAGRGVSFVSDERLLNLVLKNLVENSIKFTPAGGRVTVTVRQRSATAAEDAAERHVELAIADTGIGIPPEHRDRVFERFYQVNPARTGAAGRGTGLGLAIVKHAVAALGGTVKLQSAVDKGTTITCTFPTLEPVATPM